MLLFGISAAEVSLAPGVAEPGDAGALVGAVSLGAGEAPTVLHPANNSAVPASKTPKFRLLLRRLFPSSLNPGVRGIVVEYLL